MAIIDHSRKFIFIHVPRTGGHSAYELLGGQTPGMLHTPRFNINYDYYSFGFIRNPWDRLYSVYRRQRDMPRYKGVGFKEYLMKRILQNGIDGSAMHLLEGCDFIGKYENLHADWSTIQIKLGIEPKMLPHLNRYGDADYRKHYDNELIDYIAKLHSNDVEYGKYTF